MATFSLHQCLQKVWVNIEPCRLLRSEAEHQKQSLENWSWLNPLSPMESGAGQGLSVKCPLPLGRWSVWDSERLTSLPKTSQLSYVFQRGFAPRSGPVEAWTFPLHQMMSMIWRHALCPGKMKEYNEKTKQNKTGQRYYYLQHKSSDPGVRPDFISQLSTKEGRNCGSKSHCKDSVTIRNSKFGQSRKERWRKHNWWLQYFSTMFTLACVCICVCVWFVYVISYSVPMFALTCIPLKGYFFFFFPE